MAKQTEQLNKLVTAKARNLHISPRKMRLVTNLVKNMRVSDAVAQLKFTNKKGAPMVIKLLMSAVANAENNFSLNRDGLFIKTITCDMGAVLQRSFPRARGSAFVIRHKLAHVNLVLEERAVAKKKSSNSLVIKKSAKKADPVITKEGSAGLPKEMKAKMPREKAIKETHRENQSSSVDQKTTRNI